MTLWWLSHINGCPSLLKFCNFSLSVNIWYWYFRLKHWVVLRQWESEQIPCCSEPSSCSQVYSFLCWTSAVFSLTQVLLPMLTLGQHLRQSKFSFRRILLREFFIIKIYTERRGIHWIHGETVNPLMTLLLLVSYNSIRCKQWAWCQCQRARSYLKFERCYVCPCQLNKWHLFRPVHHSVVKVIYSYCLCVMALAERLCSLSWSVLVVLL